MTFFLKNKLAKTLALFTFFFVSTSLAGEKGGNFDAVLITQAECSIAFSDDQLKEPIGSGYRIHPGQTYTLPVNEARTISDKKKSLWKLKFQVHSRFIDEEGRYVVRHTKMGTVIKNKFLDRVELRINVSNPTITRKVKVANLSSTYGFSVKADAASNRLSASSGSFTSMFSTHLNCKINKTPVIFDDYVN